MPLFNFDETQSWNTVVIYNNWYCPLLILAAESVSTDWLFSGWVMFSAPLHTWWPWVPGTELSLPSSVLGTWIVLRFFLGLVNGMKWSHFHVFKSCFSADSQGRTGAALVLSCLSGFSVICCFFVSETNYLLVNWVPITPSGLEVEVMLKLVKEDNNIPFWLSTERIS